MTWHEDKNDACARLPRPSGDRRVGVLQLIGEHCRPAVSAGGRQLADTGAIRDDKDRIGCRRRQVRLYRPQWKYALLREHRRERQDPVFGALCRDLAPAPRPLGCDRPARRIRGSGQFHRGNQSRPEESDHLQRLAPFRVL